MNKTTERWSSRLIFLMAAIGFAVGLGNVWRFPYLVGENGGGAFILIYLACAFGIGVPLLIAEITIGRRGRQSPINSMRAVAREAGARRAWGGVGLLAVAAVFLIMTFYAVIAGWTIDYFVRAASGDFAGLSGEESKAMFADFMADPVRMGFWQAVVLGLTVYVNSRRINEGIEKAIKLMMPALVLCLVAMVVYAMIAGDRGAAVEFLLVPDFSRVTFETFLVALGQAFFSIGIAMATMMTYGAYLDRSVSIPGSAAIIVSADTAVSLLAGFVVFPLVFANGLEPSSGPGLVFVTLPIAFGEMPGGQFFGAVFFLLLIAAALTSCIGSLEPMIAWLQESRGMSRRRAARLGGIVVWVLGLGTVLSFNHLAAFHPLDFIPVFADKTLFDLKDFISSNILLLAGGLAMSIFAGWIMSDETKLAELGVRDGIGFRLWRLVVRYIAPGALAIILLGGIT